MRLNQENFKIYTFVVISMVCWSFSFIWTKIALNSFPPLTLISLRLSLASVLLFAFLKITRKLTKMKWKDLKLFLLLAFFEPFLYYVGETYGLTMVKPTLAAIIIATIPVFAPFFAFIFLKERFTMINILGIAVSLAGVYMIVNRSSDSSATSFMGVALLFVAVLSAIIYGLILRKIPQRYSATNIIMYQSLLGLLFFVPAVLIVDVRNYPLYTIQTDSIQALFMLTVFASVIAFVLFAKVVRTIGITKSQVFTNLIPVFTALFSWVLFKEIMNIEQWFGVFIVILGVFISQSRIKVRRKPQNT